MSEIQVPSIDSIELESIIASDASYLKWQEKDNLRGMTSKYNKAVSTFHERCKQLENSNNEVNQSTQHKIDEVSQEIREEIGNLTKNDIGLENVDNTSDENKPVSIAQQQAIDDAIEQFTSEFLSGAGEVSDCIKQFIEDRINEIEAGGGLINYNIASDTQLGVVKSSDDVNVDQVTGKMTIPKLVTHEQEFQAVKESLNSNNQATQKILDNQGDLDGLLTSDSTSLVSAINEVFQLGSEKKEKLVENLTALGVSCSTNETWEVLLAKVLTIMTGYDTSDSNIVASNVLHNKIAYGKTGKITGSMPNRAVSKSNGGDADSILHPTWSSQAMNHSTLTQYDDYGPSTSELTKKLILRAPEGYYDSNTRLYANPEEVAKAIGLTSDKLVSGTKVLELNGTGRGIGMGYVEICRARQDNDDSGTHFGYFELLENGYNAILLEVYRWYNYNPSVDYPIGSLFMFWGDLYDMSGSLSSSASRYIALNTNGTSPVRITLYKEYITATRQNSEYGFRLLGVKNIDRA